MSWPSAASRADHPDARVQQVGFEPSDLYVDAGVGDRAQRNAAPTSHADAGTEREPATIADAEQTRSSVLTKGADPVVLLLAPSALTAA